MMTDLTEPRTGQASCPAETTADGNFDPPKPPVLEASALNKWFGRFHALRDVNLAVPEGARIVICGPSGSGKSTLVRCINGLESFQGGTLRICGDQLTRDRRRLQAVRRQVGMVFQQFNLFPHLTVLANCTLALRRVLGRTGAEATEIARHYLDRVGIAQQAQKYPHQLSGGQQQRVAIARALCMKPKVMLFDEPTSSLDPEMVKEVLDVMTELADAGMTMLCVTHEMGFARAAADLVVFMDQGSIVEVAPPDTFFASPTQERTRAFLDKMIH
ncbi:ABC-type polar amino acid transport system ATPase subunit [Mesorhizobium sp. YL-MeA3-2017]|jgi:ABC-type polar amino acid transport system ATPase subunit|uniref:amino acid ABC transporter ATP-binding protein n=2 Tax=Phyllobacteriaceae TaxID=69277 RepID=UPI0017B2E7B9|nr:ABC-type polar amino acid transport system ATPase subunit [Mesorhizobium sp. YL-MeA3-2017]